MKEKLQTLLIVTMLLLVITPVSAIEHIRNVPPNGYEVVYLTQGPPESFIVNWSVTEGPGINLYLMTINEYNNYINPYANFTAEIEVNDTQHGSFVFPIPFISTWHFVLENPVNTTQDVTISIVIQVTDQTTTPTDPTETTTPTDSTETTTPTDPTETTNPSDNNTTAPPTGNPGVRAEDLLATLVMVILGVLIGGSTLALCIRCGQPRPEEKDYSVKYYD